MARDEFDAIRELVAADGRYRHEAYAFTLEALNYTLAQHRKSGRTGHITGQELCEGLRDYAQKQFGYLTKTVFLQWGVTRTEDFGEIVFAMVNAGLLSSQETDSKEDFAGAFDFDDVFEKDLIYE